MIVVSDTSPLNYLIVTDCVSVLRDLYELVMIPPAVFAELNDPAAPPKVKEFFAALPGWIEVRQPKSLPALPLDAGEREAIA